MRLILVRVADDAHEFIWSYHHLLLDGWCLSIVLKEVLTFYREQRVNAPVWLTPRAKTSHS